MYHDTGVELKLELRLQIAPAILNRIPSFKVGAVLYQGIEINGSPQMLKGRLRLFQESLFFDYADRSIEDESAVKEWHDAFREPESVFFRPGKRTRTDAGRHQRAALCRAEKFGG